MKIRFLLCFLLLLTSAYSAAQTLSCEVLRTLANATSTDFTNFTTFNDNTPVIILTYPKDHMLLRSFTVNDEPVVMNKNESYSDGEWDAWVSEKKFEALNYGRAKLDFLIIGGLVISGNNTTMLYRGHPDNNNYSGGSFNARTQRVGNTAEINDIITVPDIARGETTTVSLGRTSEGNLGIMKEGAEDVNAIPTSHPGVTISLNANANASADSYNVYPKDVWLFGGNSTVASDHEILATVRASNNAASGAYRKAFTVISNCL